MKILRKSYGRTSAACFAIGCLVALGIAVLGPAHTALRFRSPDTPPHMCHQMGRHMTLDQNDRGQETKIDGAIAEPLPERPLVALVATAFVGPATPVLAPPSAPLTLTNRRKLLSRRADDSDPLL